MENPKETKGKVRATIVMPKELHKKATEAAEEIGMALTSYVNMCVYNTLQGREIATLTNAMRAVQQGMSEEEYNQILQESAQEQLQEIREKKIGKK